jgi:hypothetical protein
MKKKNPQKLIQNALKKLETFEEKLRENSRLRKKNLVLMNKYVEEKNTENFLETKQKLCSGRGF